MSFEKRGHRLDDDAPRAAELTSFTANKTMGETPDMTQIPDRYRSDVADDFIDLSEWEAEDMPDLEPDFTQVLRTGPDRLDAIAAIARRMFGRQFRGRT
jgi:hypothetical protein